MADLGSVEMLLSEANCKLFNNALNNDKNRVASDLKISFKDVEFRFIGENDEKIVVHYDQSKHTDGDLKMKLLEYTGAWKSCTYTLVENKKEFLQSEIGKSYVRKFNSESEFVVKPHGEKKKSRSSDGGRGDRDHEEKVFGCLIIHQDSYTLSAMSKSDYILLKTKLDRDMHEEHVKLFDETTKKLLESEKLKSLLKDFDSKVYIKVTSDHIALVGNANTVTDLKRRIEHYFENESSSIKTVAITTGQYLLLNKCREKLLPDNVTSVLYKDHITLNGTKSELQMAEKTFNENFIQKYKSHFFDVIERGLRAESFSKEFGMAYDHIALVESQYNCAVEITDRSIDGDREKNGEDEVDDDDDETNENASPQTSSQVDIQILKGSIVQCKGTDILVNVLNADHSNMTGAIFAEFLNTCGNDLNYDLARQGFPTEFSSEPFITDAAKYNNRVNCKWIYHVYMERLDRRFRSKKQYITLKKCILKCLQNAKRQNCSSISFPTFGCGKLGYDPNEVCRSFIFAATEFKEPIEIKILTKEDRTEEIFKRTLMRRMQRRSISSFAKLGRRKNSLKFENSEEKIVTFTIHSLMGERVDEVEQDIRRKLDIVCGCLSIEHDVLACFDEVSDEFKSKLMKTLSCVSFQKDEGRLIIYGISSHLLKLKNEIEELCAKEEKNLNDLDYKYEGTKASLPKIIQLGRMIFSHYFRPHDSKSSTGPRKKVLLIKSDEKYKAVAEMVMKTWNANLARLGADARGLRHSNITISNIYLNENLDIYKDFRTAKKGFMEKFQQKNIKNPFPDLNLNRPQTCDYGHYLNSQLDKELNEVYLFHGTKEEHVDKIMHAGIDCRFSSTRTLFGPGAYFAENNKDARKPIGAKMYMILSRVLLGSAYVCTSPYGFKKPPCNQPQCGNMDGCSLHQFHDSVIGTHKDPKNKLVFKEYIVYDKNYSYPEFLIEYVRY
ncbi:hypothetical protein HELRODRAFT_193757 [Helobdella robusta]|uniref:Poly [ADP-ribose] polymerase n=1 Tax=Helobdella robusta TaxID=6412 RepID=T1FVB7_HELRO|nr:hypothetical protein HELRODRAFT_193757 [Helobdella robusta]ESN94890.1 hypothetical protein HELRODRAFT_193757 [Helobdella robusta]